MVATAGCGITCIKYTIFFVNFLLFVLGVVTVALGVYALVDKNDMEVLTMVDSHGKLEDANATGLLQKGAIVVIVVGVNLLVLGFLGCCGAIQESRCLLGMYTAIVIIIVIVQIVAAVLIILFNDRVSNYLRTGLKKGLDQHYDGIANSSDAFSRGFDFAQIYFGCCGVDSANDFNNSQWYANRTDPKMLVPVTCCELADKDAFFQNKKIELKDKQCPFKDPAADNPYTEEPCFTKIKDWISNKAGIIIGIALGIIFVQIVAIVIACYLFSAIEP